MDARREAGGLDEAEWLRCYAALERPLYNVVYRWLWDARESQDVVQEAFLRCWQKRADIRGDGFKPLVFRIALNLAANIRRRRRLWQLVSLTSVSEPAAQDGGDMAIVTQRIQNAIDALSEPLKRVLLLSELAGMSYQEIARVLNVAEGTVASRRNRAIARLRAALAAQGIDWYED